MERATDGAGSSSGRLGGRARVAAFRCPEVRWPCSRRSARRNLENDAIESCIAVGRRGRLRIEA